MNSQDAQIIRRRAAQQNNGEFVCFRLPTVFRANIFVEFDLSWLAFQVEVNRGAAWRVEL
jgi:hypothetical protein